MAHVKGKVIYESPAPVHSVNIYDIDKEKGIYKLGLVMTGPEGEYRFGKVAVNAILLHRVDEIQAAEPHRFAPEEFARIYVGGKRLYVVRPLSGEKVLTDEKP